MPDSAISIARRNRFETRTISGQTVLCAARPFWTAPTGCGNVASRAGSPCAAIGRTPGCAMRILREPCTRSGYSGRGGAGAV